jgi:cell wall-associated NlpC family hydrolase
MFRIVIIMALCLASTVFAFPSRREKPEVRALKRLEQDLNQLFFGKSVAAEAKKYLGEPYVWGGKDAAHGFDCSGLTSFVLKQMGVTVPPGALAQFQQGIAVERAALLPGDLVFFASSSYNATLHVGIFAGAGQFIHAPGEGQQVRLDRLEKNYYQLRYIGARRYQPPAPAIAPAGEARP